MNEAACGGGRYAWARSSVFLSQRNGGSIGPAMIAKRVLEKPRLTQRVEPLLTQGVRLLSPKEHNRPV